MEGYSTGANYQSTFIEIWLFKSFPTEKTIFFLENMGFSQEEKKKKEKEYQ